MNLQLFLTLTEKGYDELNNRTHKISMPKRSVLLLAQRILTIEQAIVKGVMVKDNALEAIVELARDGFISVVEKPFAQRSEANPTPNKQPTSATPVITGNGIIFSEDIILSEARFLLTNYCLDVFKMDSARFTNAISTCKTAAQASFCANQILSATIASHPDYLDRLKAIIMEINVTAS